LGVDRRSAGEMEIPHAMLTFIALLIALLLFQDFAAGMRRLG
jgi:hypothetical protein